MNKSTKKATLTITSSDGAKVLRCGDYMDFGIVPISDVHVNVVGEDGEDLFDDDIEICPTWSGYKQIISSRIQIKKGNINTFPGRGFIL